MNYKRVPELQSLLDAVEKKYGAPLMSTNDFNVLSALLKFEGRETLSASTLKRLWRYVSQETTPRKTTLDVLARFVGYKDFRDYRLSLLGESSESSEFLETYTLAASDIANGETVVLGWEPNRLIKIVKKSDDLFEVTESLNSKLCEGDRFQCSFFFKGLPLVMPYVERSGQRLPSYIAGKAKGLNLIKIER